MIADFTGPEYIKGMAVTLLFYIVLPAALVFFLAWAIGKRSKHK